MISGGSVQGRTAVGRQQTNQVIEQPVVRHEVAAEPEDPAEGTGEQIRAERRHRLAEDRNVGLSFPAPPEHPEMGIVQFMREETESFLRMEITECQPVGCCAVCTDEQRQEMLGYLYGQVSELLFMVRSESGRRIAERCCKPAAADTEMGTVVGEADIRHIGKNNKVCRDDARFAQFCHSIELAARQHLVAELHVAVLLFALVPAGQAGTHEQLPVETVGDKVIQFFLAHGRVGREIYFCFLAALGKSECLVRICYEQLRKEKAKRGFPGDFPAPSHGQASS